MSYQPQGYNPYQQAQPGWSNYPPNQGAPVYGGDPNAAEGGVPKREMGFTDKTIRASFIRKVFTLVAVMLAVVTVMTAVPFMHSPTMEFVRANRWVYFLSFVSFFVVYIALMCCEGVRRTFPTNLICTGILTLSIGYMTMMISAFHSTQVVLMALTITTVCCGGIILFSMQTKIDLTKMLGFLCLAGLILMVYGFVAIFAIAFFHVKLFYTIYSGLAALLFMFYLAVDIQMVMGGKKFEISPEEHIFAAIQIFLDIVYIFWMLLSLLNNN